MTLVSWYKMPKDYYENKNKENWYWTNLNYYTNIILNYDHLEKSKIPFYATVLYTRQFGMFLDNI